MAQNVVDTDTLTPYRSLCWAMSNQLDALNRGVASGFRNDNLSNATPPAPLNQTATTLMAQNINSASVALGNLTALFGQPSNSAASTAAQAIIKTLAETNTRIFSTWSNGTTFYGAPLYVPPPPPPFTPPTGGTVTTIGIYTLHTFTLGGTFTVFTPINVECLVLGGGGGGGGYIAGGGGGAGQYIVTAHSLPSGPSSFVVGPGGVGGTPVTKNGDPGQDSFAFGVVAKGGCFGQGDPITTPLPIIYANGGGGCQGQPAGASTTGNPGGAGIIIGSGRGGGGGGGGIGSPGGAAIDVGAAGVDTQGGIGGNGSIAYLFGPASGVSFNVGGGGGGGGVFGGAIQAGYGGGAGGASQVNGANAIPHRGGGGGGGGDPGSPAVVTTGGNGGYGLVVVAYVTPV